MFKIIFKDIKCSFTEKAFEIIQEEQRAKDFLNHFFYCIESDKEEIEWIDENNMPNKDVVPMYSISNGKETLLLWLAISNGEKVILINSLKEEPELKDQISTD